MTTITLSTLDTAEQSASVELHVFESASAGPSSDVPLFVPRAQIYYWTEEWQAGEAEALRDLAEGNVRRFASGAEASRWLLADDAD